jgi:hypothetical protein
MPHGGSDSRRLVYVYNKQKLTGGYWRAVFWGPVFRQVHVPLFPSYSISPYTSIGLLLPHLSDCVAVRHPGQIPQRGMLALLNLASGECAKRNSTGRAGIQNNLIYRLFPGFRVSPKALSSLSLCKQGYGTGLQGSPGMTFLQLRTTLQWRAFPARYPVKADLCRQSLLHQGHRKTLKPYRPNKGILACIPGSATQILLNS